MKSRFTFAVGLLAIASSGVSSADTTINITGSTAFRAAVHSSILAVMTGESYAYEAANLADSTRAIFVGTVAGISGVTTIRTHWTGSAAGVTSVATASTSGLNFYPTDTVVSTSGVPSAPAGATGFQPAIARFAFSDVTQASTTTRTPVLQSVGVGVVPFEFFTNVKGAAEVNLTNITPQSFEVLSSTGAVPLSLFTGVPADADKIVLATGRSSTSGTRITALAETGYGISTSVAQYVSPVYQAVTGNLIGLSPSTGTSGLADGPAVATILGRNSDAVVIGGETYSAILISYLGTADAVNAIAAGAKPLKYNGVSYSEAAVRNGTYTFWGYQNLLNPTVLVAEETTFRTALINAIPTNLGNAGIATTTMNVVRDGGDGGLVSPK